MAYLVFDQNNYFFPEFRINRLEKRFCLLFPITLFWLLTNVPARNVEGGFVPRGNVDLGSRGLGVEVMF